MLIKDRLTIPSSRKYTDEGFLIVPAKISRTGIQEYYAIEMGLKDRDATDVIRVHRPESEVFSEDSLNSFSNKPVTNDHPPELVNSENAKKYSVGHSGPEVTRDGIYAETVLFVTDKMAIEQIESGKVELSNGYTSDIDWTPGVTSEGEKYDAIQRNIKGNHIAIVKSGRCGSACRMSDTNPHSEGLNMPQVIIDGVSYEASEQVVQAVAKLEQRVTDAEEEMKEKDNEAEKAKKDKDEAEKEAKKTTDGLQAKLDDAVAKQPTPEMLDALVDNRIAVRDAAVKFDKDYDWKGKDCETIRKDIVSTHCKDVDIENVSVEYIKARFDALVEIQANTNHVDNAMEQQHNKDGSGEGTGNPVNDARNKFAERNRNAWKGGNE